MLLPLVPVLGAMVPLPDVLSGTVVVDEVPVLGETVPLPVVPVVPVLSGIVVVVEEVPEPLPDGLAL